MKRATKKPTTGASWLARGRNYLRAGIESVVGLAGGTAWYWIDRERQVADWDFPSVKQRFTLEAWRYDNNPFAINHIWHPTSGTLFHLAGRSNDLSLPVSAGYGFVASMLWEYALEFREKISVNDVMVTPGAGITMGEFFHWLRPLRAKRSGRHRRWTRGSRLGRWVSLAS